MLSRESIKRRALHRQGIQPRECQCRNTPVAGLQKGNRAQPSSPKKSRSLRRWHRAVGNDWPLAYVARKGARAAISDRTALPRPRTIIAVEAEAARMLQSRVLHGKYKPSL